MKLSRFILSLLLPVLPMVAGETQAGGPASLVNVPLYFEANRGQAAEEFKFLSRGKQQNFLISPTEAIVNLVKIESTIPLDGLDKTSRPQFTAESRSVTLQFLGANSNAVVTGVGELSGKVNYIVGNDPARWHTGVPTYTQVQVENLYPGIGLRYYGNQHQLEYDFTIAPGVDAGAIATRFGGADGLSIGAQGELILKLGDAEIRQPKPGIYQVVNGLRKSVTGSYHLRDAQTVEFAIGDYDHDLPLIIDPMLAYSTYLGGSGVDIAWSMALDANTNIYIAGQTTSSPFATNSFPNVSTNSFTNFSGGGFTGDAFVAKFTGDGSNFVYFTYLGGGADDAAFGVAVDGSGNAYVTGFTQSPNFPSRSLLLNNINTNAIGNGTATYTNINSPYDPLFKYFRSDAFITELDTNGGMVYSLFLGGSSDDVGIGVALDPANNVYVTGYTYSTNYPVTPNACQLQLAGSNDVFVTKISADGQTVPYSTYFGGGRYDQGQAIAVDAAQNAYVAGYSFSTNIYLNSVVGLLTNLYTTNLVIAGVTNPISFRRTLNGMDSIPGSDQFDDAFIAKFNTLASGPGSLSYFTLLGGSNNDAAFGIALDTQNNAYVVGYSQSFDFPAANNNIVNLTNGNIAVNGANQDAFLAKISSDGKGLLYSSVFGGIGNDIAYGVAVDPSGRVFMTGKTLSPNFPTNNPFGFLRQLPAGGFDVFVTALDPGLSNAPLYWVYIGGAADDIGHAIVADADGSAYVTGTTASGDFPATNTPPSVGRGGGDAFLSKIVLAPSVLALSSGTGTNGFSISWPGIFPEYSQFILETNGNLGITNGWAALPNTLTSTNGNNIVVTIGITNAPLFFRLHKP